MLWGAEPPEQIAIDEYGMKILVDVRHGQKTGLFLDQRENRRLVRRAGPRPARGAQPLQLHRRLLGGGGPGRLDPRGLQRPRRRRARSWPAQTFKANGLDPADHAFANGDAFDLLANYKRQGRQFDLVVCDPPAFAKSQKAVEGALAGYASLNRAALQVLAPGGLLVTCSCSARVSAEQFGDAVKEAAFKIAHRAGAGGRDPPALRPPRQPAVQGGAVPEGDGAAPAVVTARGTQEGAGRRRRGSQRRAAAASSA